MRLLQVHANWASDDTGQFWIMLASSMGLFGFVWTSFSLSGHTACGEICEQIIPYMSTASLQTILTQDELCSTCPPTPPVAGYTTTRESFVQLQIPWAG